ncbi:hypothetical protein CSKR_109252 [Clonorchis sinensis]|uniref:Uncharacterized protein n=1 Tax=Clonorchis sinensis TaxID=79923 RepID=A0A3R7GBT0_CLOSI|nr:hypothetical protein CSKR_109252 [Clonorchis sinensis]
MSHQLSNFEPAFIQSTSLPRVHKLSDRLLLTELSDDLVFQAVNIIVAICLHQHRQHEIQKNEDGWGKDIVLAYYTHSKDLQTPFRLSLRTPLTPVTSDNLQRSQPGAVGIMQPPSWKASHANSTQNFRNLFHIPPLGQRLATGWLQREVAAATFRLVEVTY